MRFNQRQQRTKPIDIDLDPDVMAACFVPRSVVIPSIWCWIVTELFNLNQAEIENISNMCQFLFDNLLIQAIPIIEKAKYYAWNWIKRKIG